VRTDTRRCASSISTTTTTRCAGPRSS
jgi:hypothetical protein